VGVKKDRGKTERPVEIRRAALLIIIR